MALKAQRNAAEFERPQTRRRRGGKLKYGLGLMLLTGIILVVFLPTMVARRSILVPLIDRFAGLAPLKLDLETVQVGWFKPVRVGGIQLLDAQGKLLVKVAQVETEKGLWSWIRNSNALGNIRLHGIEAVVATGGGTTNIEQALKPVLDKYVVTDPTDEEATEDSLLPTGSIDVLDSKFLLMQSGRPEQWLVSVPKLSMMLPTASQTIGPIELQATLSDMSGTVANSTGSIAASVSQNAASQAFEMRAKIDAVPVDVWHVVHARLPDIPVDELRGRLTAVVSGNFMDADRWSIDVQRIESQGLQIVSPAWVGTNPAQLQFVAAAGRATLADAKLTVEGAQLGCDFAQVSAAAEIPWPMEFPTAAHPFLGTALIDTSGVIDLPKLVQAAQSLIPIRDDTKLLAGQARFALSQTRDAQGAPASRAQLELTGLQAMAGGQEISWKDPLNVEVAANLGNAGLQIAASAAAEFCNLQAGGSIQQGHVGGHLDLELLHQRVSQYVELPISTMTGEADLEMTWKMTSEQTVSASGTLKTTPLLLAATGAGQIEEPAWNGEFSATATLVGGTPERIDAAQLTLKSRDEQLSVDLQGPLSLQAASSTQAVLPPAPFRLNLVGDLANWKRRGTMWLSQPPEVTVSGNVSLAVGGRVDLQHAEVLEANWRTQPLNLSTPQLSLAEPQMVGNFKGRVDTNDLTRLVVEKLEVQSTSFSLGARDSAGPEGSGSRIGQAMFLVDLDRLMKNVLSPVTEPTQVLPPLSPLAGQSATVASGPPETRYSVTGRVQGQLAWQVNPQAAAFEIRADGENIVVLAQAPSAIAPVPMWEEPRVTSLIAGKWTVATGDANIENLQIQLPWMNYAGNLAYRTVDQRQSIAMKGQAVYDSVALSTKLAPMTGNHLQLYGQQTVPIELTWTSPVDAQASSLSGLKAAARIGWSEARVVGIQLGKADVPVNIDAGNLATAAEFAVSGGVLRWDVTSDLTAADLVIVQKPMTVLENVAITPEMCQGWLKYVAPLVAEATSIDGRLSLRLNDARLTPADPKKQTVAGQLIMHNVTVGPGPLSNQVIGLVKQVDAIRKKDFTQAVSTTQHVWMNMPEQQIDFQMADGRVIHRNVSVRVGDANISTAGSVTVDGQLEMLATMPIPDDWIDKSPLLVGMRGQSLNFPVRGTISKPQLDAQGLQQFGRQAVQSAASGLIQQQLSKGLGKLFGAPPPTTPATAPPALPTGN
jgi:translocation and assembly module TamB